MKPILLVFIILQTIFHTWGDSNTSGSFVPADKTYAGLVATKMGWTLVNHAIPGSQCGDQVPYIYSTPISTDNVHSLMIGTGDETVYQNNPNKRKAFGLCHLAALIALAIPESSKVWATDSRIAYTGQWNPTPVPWTHGMYTYEVGATARLEIPEGDYSAIYIESLMQNGITDAEFNVSVDGVDNGQYTTLPPNGVDITTNLNATFMSFPVRIPVSRGSHIVLITITKASFGHPVYLNFIGASSSSSKVYVANILPLTDYTNRGSQQILEAYNQVIDENERLLMGDKLNIIPVNAYGVVDVNSDYLDFVHLNITGQAKLAGAYLGARGR